MADFSCYVTVFNQTLKPLRRDDCQAIWGRWDGGMPPAIIPANQAPSFQIEDPVGEAAGSEGWVTYIVEDAKGVKGTIKLYFECPYAEHNKVSAEWQTTEKPSVNVTIRAKSDDKKWQDGGVQILGHPLYVDFTIDEKPLQ